jgi:hypothetical protein
LFEAVAGELRVEITFVMPSQKVPAEPAPAPPVELTSPPISAARHCLRRLSAAGGRWGGWKRSRRARAVPFFRGRRVCARGSSAPSAYSNVWTPYCSRLAVWCIEALTAAKTTKEKMALAEFNRVAGEIALRSPERDLVKAQSYFEHALAIARQQQAKSWKLRAAVSLARLWRDQGKTQQARELLAPVYEWFTEGFDTRDLKEAKALLDVLECKAEE